MFNTVCGTEACAGSQNVIIQCILRYCTACETCLYLGFSEVTNVFYAEDYLFNVYHSAYKAILKYF